MNITKHTAPSERTVDARALASKLRENHARLADADHRTRDALWGEIFALQHALAVEYGARRGWRLAHTTFDPFDVFRGGRVRSSYRWFKAPIDHPFFYRDLSGRAVAIVSFEYNALEPRQAWAQDHGLILEVEERFPNFYLFDTSFLVFRRDDDALTMNQIRLRAASLEYRRRTGRTPNLYNFAEAFAEAAPGGTFAGLLGDIWNGGAHAA